MTSKVVGFELESGSCIVSEERIPKRRALKLARMTDFSHLMTPRSRRRPRHE